MRSIEEVAADFKVNKASWQELHDTMTYWLLINILQSYTDIQHIVGGYIRKGGNDFDDGWNACLNNTIGTINAIIEDIKNVQDED